MPIESPPLVWAPPALRELLRWPLPDQGFLDRSLLRGLALLARGRVLEVSGLQHVAPARDPFILALNHNNRAEAILVPALLALHRGGRPVHFLADWNYRLIPGVGLIYRRGGALTVTAKPARPRLLNAFRPLYRQSLSVLARARLCLREGRSIGLFPEGAVNRDPRRLLAGRRSAALLSLETGAPVIPVGIRFPRATLGQPISDRDAMTVRIGTPLHPPPPAEGRASPDAVRAWHAAIMTEIARLSGKVWNPDREETP